MSFNDYINNLRVEEVIRHFHLLKQKQYSLLGIAFDAGFNSKSTFNRAFKRVTGLSPSQYLQHNDGSTDPMTR